MAWTIAEGIILAVLGLIALGGGLCVAGFCAILFIEFIFSSSSTQTREKPKPPVVQYVYPGPAWLRWAWLIWLAPWLLLMTIEWFLKS